MFKAKVTNIGNSLGLVLPKHLADSKRIRKGDIVFVDVIRPEDSDEFEDFMEAVEDSMHRYPNTLKALAK